MKIILPNFIIVGATRCGTTAIYNYLKTHPDIYMSEEKEVRFFHHDNKFLKGGVELYSRYFSHHNDEKIIGEATPNYLHIENVPERIFKTIPNVKLLFCFRNPVDRAYSQYWQKFMLGVENLSFNAAIEQESKRIKNGNITDYAYLYKGKYISHLKNYYKYFSSSQIFVIFTEDFYSQKAETLRSILKFLNVDSNFKFYDLPIKQKNSARTPIITFIPRMINNISERNNFFKKKLYKLNRILNTRQGYPPMDAKLRENLNKYFEPYNQELAKFLGSKVPWTK